MMLNNNTSYEKLQNLKHRIFENEEITQAKGFTVSHKAGKKVKEMGNELSKLMSIKEHIDS